MKTVGQLLKSAREQQAFSLGEVEKATKIRVKYLEALENDQYASLPSGTYARGFIKNYALFLRLPVETLLAVFRRDFTEDERGHIVPRSIVNPVVNQKMMWTPRATMISLMVVILTVFVGFIVFQYQSLIRPKLEVVVPVENEIVLGPTVTVSGITDPAAVVAINNQLVIVKPDGSFTGQLDLSEGRAEIVVEATNSRGYKTLAKRVVEVRKEK